MKSDSDTSTRDVNSFSLRLDMICQNLVDLTRDVDNTQQESKWRLAAIDGLGPRLDAVNGDLNRRLDAINQDLQRRLDAFKTALDSLGQRLDFINQNLSNVSQRLEITNQDLARRLSRLSHNIYAFQPCCIVM